MQLICFCPGRPPLEEILGSRKKNKVCILILLFRYYDIWGIWCWVMLDILFSLHEEVCNDKFMYDVNLLNNFQKFRAFQARSSFASIFDLQKWVLSKLIARTFEQDKEVWQFSLNNQSLCLKKEYTYVDIFSISLLCCSYSNTSVNFNFTFNFQLILIIK